MPEIIKSELTGREYRLGSAVRLVNPKQVIMYVSRGVYPVDMYVSKDFATNRPILVYLFDKQETKELYAEWLANRPQKEGSEDE